MSIKKKKEYIGPHFKTLNIQGLSKSCPLTKFSETNLLRITWKRYSWKRLLPPLKLSVGTFFFRPGPFAYTTYRTNVLKYSTNNIVYMKALWNEKLMIKWFKSISNYDSNSSLELNVKLLDKRKGLCFYSSHISFSQRALLFKSTTTYAKHNNVKCHKLIATEN